MRYLDDGMLRGDSKGVENPIRPIALGRSNWLFAGSLRAGRRAPPAIITLDVIHATRYYAGVAIKTFECADSEALFRLRRVARFANIERPALRKLKQLELARRIEDLRAPPANRLELLKGDRAGQWSIRVNDQFRICFRWTGADAEDVEIVDYH
jgi:proteic killer suppression protein